MDDKLLESWNSIVDELKKDNTRLEACKDLFTFVLKCYW